MIDEEKRRLLFDPYHRPLPRGRGRPAWVSILFALGGVFGFSFCLTCLYLGMRAIMSLGGMVASGGPYAIAHPAPGYVWVIPVSIWVGLIGVFLHAVGIKAVGGLNLAPLTWPALFISLGWNFLEFAFHPPGDGGLAWGWLVCGVVFWAMGFIPLVLIILYARQKFRADRLNAKFRAQADLADGGRAGTGSGAVLLVELALVALGVYLAISFFASLTKV